MKHAPFIEITELGGTKHYINIAHIQQVMERMHGSIDLQPVVCVVDQGEAIEYRTKESYEELLGRLDYAYRED